MVTKRKHPPEVDDTDVDELIELLTSRPKPPSMTQEERAEIAYQAAVNLAKCWGHTTAWAEEFARRVRKRILWAKSSD